VSTNEASLSSISFLPSLFPTSRSVCTAADGTERIPSLPARINRWEAAGHERHAELDPDGAPRCAVRHALTVVAVLWSPRSSRFSSFLPPHFHRFSLLTNIQKHSSCTSSYSFWEPSRPQPLPPQSYKTSPPTLATERTAGLSVTSPCGGQRRTAACSLRSSPR
jgi:hypothetical protein